MLTPIGIVFNFFNFFNFHELLLVNFHFNFSNSFQIYKTGMKRQTTICLDSNPVIKHIRVQIYEKK